MEGSVLSFLKVEWTTQAHPTEPLVSQWFKSYTSDIWAQWFLAQNIWIDFGYSDHTRFELRRPKVPKSGSVLLLLKLKLKKKICSILYSCNNVKIDI